MSNFRLKFDSDRRHRCVGASNLIGRAGVGGDFAQTAVAGDRRDLVGRAAHLSDPACNHLAEPVGRYPFKSRWAL